MPRHSVVVGSVPPNNLHDELVLRGKVMVKGPLWNLCRLQDLIDSGRCISRSVDQPETGFDQVFFRRLLAHVSTNRLV